MNVFLLLLIKQEVDFCTNMAMGIITDTDWSRKELYHTRNLIYKQLSSCVPAFKTVIRIQDRSAYNSSTILNNFENPNWTNPQFTLNDTDLGSLGTQHHCLWELGTYISWSLTLDQDMFLLFLENICLQQVNISSSTHSQPITCQENTAG